MRLTKLTYQDRKWELKNLSLRPINLIVGKNAVGKSRTLSTIDLLVKMLSQRRELNWSGRWELEFMTHREDRITMTFATTYLKDQNSGKVTAEKIDLNGRQVLFRHPDGHVTLWNHLDRNSETAFPPSDKLTVHTNRDIRKYPYLEEIAGWADRSFGFKFGNISPHTRLATQAYDLLTTVEDVPQLFASLSESDRTQVKDSFNSLGYNLERISIVKRGDFILYLKERDLPDLIPHFQLSQGMFRSLAVLIYFRYLISRRRPATVVIDDLCEGLDYARATKLGRLIFEICRDSEIQIVATSNDSFLMEVVDIAHWSLLKRNGKTVTAINSESHPQLFKEFRFTGLSNFDLFSSDFIEQHAL